MKKFCELRIGNLCLDEDAEVADQQIFSQRGEAKGAAGATDVAQSSEAGDPQEPAINPRAIS